MFKLWTLFLGGTTAVLQPNLFMLCLRTKQEADGKQQF